MMHFRLIWKNAFRNKRRTSLTVMSVAASLFLLACMLCFLTSMDAGVERAGGSSRVVVRHATSLTFFLPVSYTDKLKAVPHVKTVHASTWFGGMIEGREDLFFSNFGADIETMEAVWDEYKFPPGAVEKLRAEPRGALVGKRLLEKMSREKQWALGQTVSLTSPIYQKTLEFVLVDTITGPDENLMLFRFDYLEKARGNPGEVGTFWVKVDDRNNIPGVCTEVDKMFENSQYPTKTETEKAFQEGFMAMMGNIQGMLVKLGLVVVVTILFVAANTMAMAARERVTEQAVMRTLGFSAARIGGMFVAESILVCLFGAILGVGAPAFFFRKGNFDLNGFAPDFHMNLRSILICTGVALLVGFCAGILPAINGARRSIVDGLRKVD